MYYTRVLLASLYFLFHQKSTRPFAEALAHQNLAGTLAFCAFHIFLNYLILCAVWYLFQSLFPYFISRSSSSKTKLRLSQVSGRVFLVIFTYYRLSRTFLLLMIIPNMSKVIRMMMPRKYYNKFCRPKEISPMVLQKRLQLPWLMLCSHPFSVKEHSFFSLSEQRFHKSCPPLMSRRNCVGSIEGWLIMVDNVLWRPEGFMTLRSFYSLFNETNTRSIPTVNFFLNQMSGARVDLPSQSTISCRNSNQPSFFRKVVASSAPTSNPNCRCLVAALCSNGRLAFCRPSAKSWTLIQEEKGLQERLYFEDIEIVDGKLYGATNQASRFLVVFDIQDGNADGYPTYTVERLVMLQPWPVPLRRVPSVYTKRVLESIHLAKDATSNELFLILRENSYVLQSDPDIPWSVIIGDQNYVNPPKTRGFRVFKLTQEHPHQWVETDNLGDRTLFLSEAANKIVAVNYINGSHKLERNCIYFAYDNPYLSSLVYDTFYKRYFATPVREHDVGVYSLTEKNIRSLANFSKDYFRSRLHSRPVWFCPS